MEYIFHETQDGSLCAQHCLNSLLQGDYYSAVDLAQIAEQLDTQERLHMSEAGTSSSDYQQFLSQESSNYDDSGFFSIQVLQKALEPWNIELIPYKSKNAIADNARKNPIEQKAFICKFLNAVLSFKQHWYTIRRIANYWFNLNSLLKKPQLISDTYLAILLAQLEADGYSIFVVSGELNKTQADVKLYEQPLNVKKILASSAQNAQRTYDESDNEDDELKKALEMSLIENDKELDAKRLTKAYPNAQFNADYDDDLNKAIQMSLMQGNSNQSTSNNNSTTSTSTAAPNVELSPNTIRKKRLEHFEQQQQQKKD